jgi:LmbE family N-acetylglucosaminyl deacetylase
MKSKAVLAACVILFTVLTLTPAEVPEDRGAMGLSQALNRLDIVASVLHTGAHPDDENSALLAWLARGEGVRTAYLSATRGDGGQNLLGTELFEALGVIRTEELLAARRADHGEQFFTPVYEFGFSKSAEESFEKWGREQLLGDFVRVIRQFRPEIIVSRFRGTAQDGHGHHQAAGIMTQEAFAVAADPNRFPEYGRPWQAKKLYLSGAGGGGNAQAGAPAVPSITMNTGEFDTVLGRSYAEIAAEGRSLHQSQGQGSARNRGPSTTSLQLARKTVDVADNAGFFDGVLHRLSDLARLEPGLSGDLTSLEQRITAIRERINLANPGGIVPDLAAALTQVQQMRGKATNEHVRFLLEQKESDFQEATRLAAGLVLDVLAQDETVVPGQTFNLTVSVVNGGRYAFPLPRVSFDLPAGWNATLVPPEATGGGGARGGRGGQAGQGGGRGGQGRGGAGPPAAAPPVVTSLAAGQRYDQVYSVQVPTTASFTQPYWLREPRRGDRFVWPQGSPANMPFDPPLLRTRSSVDYQGAVISMERPAEFRSVDRMTGERRSQLKVVPEWSVRVSPDVAIIPIGGSRQKEFTVSVENQSTGPVSGEVRLAVPTSWRVTPASQPVQFTRQGERTSLQFRVTAPATAGDFTIQAVGQIGNREFRTGYTTVAYPHIETHYIYAPAQSKVSVFDVKTSVTSLGYVEGVGDTVPDSLRQLGINVTMLSPQDLATGDLSKFPAIVLGIRAYQARDDLRAYNKRLLDYVSNGGNLIVQYNRSEDVGNLQFGPYPFTINNNDRVTREDAPVRVLQPSHPLLNVPNRITSADFDGWVQERGTYFLRTFDPQYVPLLESADPGEEPLKGGLVVAKYGKGSYIYTGYVFFRQLPAGGKGAYRLFANLVSIEN